MLLFSPFCQNFFSAVTNMTQTEDPLKIAIFEIGYQPFISFFNLTKASINGTQVSGIVDYAAVVALQVSLDTNGHPNIGARFKNGSSDPTFSELSIFGTTGYPYNDFVSSLTGAAITTTAQWCSLCNQTTLRGCAA